VAADLITERAAALDAADPLAGFREAFVLDDAGPLYVDGNSLGRLPHATAERIKDLVDEWGARLVTAWPDWIEAPARIGDLLAEHILGARPGEVLACDSVTVNLFKLAGAVLAERPGPVVGLTTDFPTDRYVLEGLAAQHRVELRLVGPDRLASAARGASLIVLSHVDYRSGEVADMARITALGPTVLWDLSHAAGAVELDLRGTGAELAVGCTYKYLNGGPGAPAWLYVREELQDRLRSPIQGWFGQRDQFAMGPRYEPTEGVERFLAGTPVILGLAAVEAGAELTARAGMPAIAAKTRALTDLFVEAADAWLAPLGFTLASPRDALRRGGHVSLGHPDAWPICRALIERAGVVGTEVGDDAGGLVRFAFPALYTRFADVAEAARRTRDLVEAGEHRLVDATRTRVT
jgi:kynureninase